jgi:acyl-lipid omega-6 desaturase (Delta-12 desaturase)
MKDMTRPLPESMYDWGRTLEPYRRHDDGRGAIELIITFVPFAAFWVASWAAYSYGLPWLSLLLAVPGGAFLVRLFMIQHDCGHGSFVSNKRMGDWIGRIIGVLTLTPYDVWKRTHAVHHATCGNLDRRGIGDITTLTVREYGSLSPFRRFAYRVYRHPLVLFGLGPSYLFFIQQRLPVGLMSSGWRPWLSTQGTNLAIAAVAAGFVWWMGAGAFLFVHVPIVIFGATAGVWLFYVQHQFERTSWEHSDRWSYAHAALHGSSYYALPPALHWLTANIGVHHVHHLCSRVPYYKLSSVVRDYPQLREIGRLGLGESFRAVRLTLWDEDRLKLVSFADASDRRTANAATPFNDQQPDPGSIDGRRV